MLQSGLAGIVKSKEEDLRVLVAKAEVSLAGHENKNHGFASEPMCVDFNQRSCDAQNIGEPVHDEHADLGIGISHACKPTSSSCFSARKISNPHIEPPTPQKQPGESHAEFGPKRHSEGFFDPKLLQRHEERLYGMQRAF